MNDVCHLTGSTWRGRKYFLMYPIAELFKDCSVPGYECMKFMCLSTILMFRRLDMQLSSYNMPQHNYEGVLDSQVSVQFYSSSRHVPLSQTRPAPLEWSAKSASLIAILCQSSIFNVVQNIWLHTIGLSSWLESLFILVMLLAVQWPFVEF